MKKMRRQKGTIESDRTVATIPQHTSEINKKPKFKLFEEYRCFNTWRLMPVSQEALEKLRENGIRWAISDDNALKVSQFLTLNGISKDTWNRWRDKYPEIKEAHAVMLMAIGDRREVGMLTRKFDSGSTMKSMPIYDEDWTRLDEWKAKLTNKDDVPGGQQWVVIEKAANSPMVPERKEEE